MEFFLSTYKDHYASPKWMSQSEVFRPSNGPLLVRGNLSDGLPSKADFKKNRPSSQSGYGFGRLSHNSFFARHNPHPGRVRHIKGLLDVPICSVNDNGYFANARYSMQFPPNHHDSHKLKSYSAHMDRIPVNAINVNTQKYPIDTITGLQYFCGKPLNFRVFREKALPKVGMVPVTEAWRDELHALTEAVGVSSTNLPKIQEPKARTPATADGNRPRTSQYSANTGRLIPPPSRAMSRQGSRQNKRTHFFNQLEHIVGEPDMESMILQMLCQILQTDDVNAVQAWLVSAGDREKALVLDMIRSALSNDDFANKVAGNDNERSRSAFHDVMEEGDLIGGQSDDINKQIDRLSLIDDGMPRATSQMDRGYSCTPLGMDTNRGFQKLHFIEENDDIHPPVNNDVFRPSKSRGSDRPASQMSRSKTPVKPQSPGAEPKLRYTMTETKEKDMTLQPIELNDEAGNTSS